MGHIALQARLKKLTVHVYRELGNHDGWCSQGRASRRGCWINEIFWCSRQHQISGVRRKLDHPKRIDEAGGYVPVYSNNRVISLHFQGYIMYIDSIFFENGK